VQQQHAAILFRQLIDEGADLLAHLESFGCHVRIIRPCHRMLRVMAG